MGSQCTWSNRHACSTKQVYVCSTKRMCMGSQADMHGQPSGYPWLTKWLRLCMVNQADVHGQYSGRYRVAKKASSDPQPAV